MEDVTTRDAGRGQLLVVTALSLALLLSILALALNSAGLGGVHVAQADDGFESERAADQVRNAVRRGVAGLIPATNERYVEYTNLEDGLDAAVGNWSDLAAEEYARDAVAVRASLASASFETRIVQNDSREFTDQGGSTAWTVAENVSAVDRYEANVPESGDLVDSDDCSDDGCFALTVEGSGDDEWRLFVHTTGTDAVAIVVESSDGSTEECGTSASDARINVTDGTFDDGADECSFTTFREDAAVDPPYTLTYENANNVTGTYNATVDGRLVDGNISDDDRYGTTGSPRLDPRIDAANVTVRYRSTDLRYRTEIRVLPGDDDD